MTSAPLLFDTSAVVSLVERADGQAIDLVRQSADRPFVSFVTLAELHVGVRAASDEPTRSLRARTLRRAESFRQLPIDRTILDAYADARLARIRGNDAWIAATARLADAHLVTADEVLATRALGFVEVTFLGP